MTRRQALNGQPASAVEPQPAPSPRSPFAPIQLVIPQGLEIRGDLISKQALKVEGTVQGRILAVGQDLAVDPRGQVRADISARSVVVRGSVEGDIVATERVEITPRGSVRGAIRAPRVVLADGAKFHGRVNREANEAPVVDAAALRLASVFVPREGTDQRPASPAPSKNGGGLSIWNFVEARSEH